MRGYSFIAMLALLMAVVSSSMADLQAFTNVTLIEAGGNDGDSFVVHLDKNRDVRVRLYYVDCPESSASWESDFRRVREQGRYFGLPDESLVIAYGKAATDFTREALQEPFTVYTAFASALGRYPHGRVYSFVRTADGRDLGALLVENGLARVYGVGRETPDGIPRDEWKAQLSDLEVAAMLKNVGMWEQSDPDELAKMRADQRREELELKEIRKDVREGNADKPIEKQSINEADRQFLQSIPGIGPALARRIIEGRPYVSLEDLRNVKGISDHKLAEIRRYAVCP
jgi:endonuclease YncB( thermonuclease family)